MRSRVPPAFDETFMRLRAAWPEPYRLHSVWWYVDSLVCCRAWCIRKRGAKCRACFDAGLERVRCGAARFDSAFDSVEARQRIDRP